MKNLLKYLTALVVSVTMVGCGGGGGDAGTKGSSTPTTTTTGTPTVHISTFSYELDKPTMNNSGADRVVLSITALDTNNNPVGSATATISIDTGIFTPSGTSTDTNGMLTGTVTIGANKSNRTMQLKMLMDGKQAEASVGVIGSVISMTPIPATPSIGNSFRIDLKLTDANGTGVRNIPVKLSGTLGFSGTVTTDNTGAATANLPSLAVPSAGNYTVIAEALGITTTQSVTVLGSGTNSGIATVTQVVTASSLSAVPTTVAPNSANSTTSRAGLYAKFLDGSNNGIQNIRVRFMIANPLGNGEAISVGSTLVYTDAAGVATADYIPGTRTSPTNGVQLIACYGFTDAEMFSDKEQQIPTCPRSVSTNLTVATKPLSVSIGDDNQVYKGLNNVTYIKYFDVAVADAAGNPVPSAVISSSIDITHYGKGWFDYSYSQTLGQPPNIGQTFSNTDDPFSTTPNHRVWCSNEDLNRNASLDNGEDINGNGKLDPRKADAILSFVDTNVTDKAGRLTMKVEYAQRYASWISVAIKATTNVGGSEGTDVRRYILPYSIDDLETGAFRTAPYGAKSCIDPG